MIMAPPLLRLDNIFVTFGGTPLLSDASLSVSEGDRIALVGRNGSGKSTQAQYVIYHKLQTWMALKLYVTMLRRV